MVKVVPQDNFLRQQMIYSELLGRARLLIAGRFSVRRAEPVIAVTLLFRDELFEDAVWDAKDKGILAKSECFRIMDTDMIVRGISRDTGKDTLIAVESSFTVHDGDIVRVNRTASALRKVFPDADVWAAVYCAAISDENSRRAEDDGVEVISNVRV